MAAQCKDLALLFLRGRWWYGNRSDEAMPQLQVSTTKPQPPISATERHNR
jgi:hypothetical protein